MRSSLGSSFGGVDATNAGRIVVGFGCIDGGGLICVVCIGAGDVRARRGRREVRYLRLTGFCQED